MCGWVSTCVMVPQEAPNEVQCTKQDALIAKDPRYLGIFGMRATL